MAHCLLCGTPYVETDAYCPGEQCGTDLHGQRAGDPTCAVQAWCEPRRVTAAPGETVVVTLTLRNAGTAPDRYDPELPGDLARRIGLDRSGPPDVQPGGRRAWTIVYTVPADIAETAVTGGLFGLGDVGVEGGGSAYEDASRVVEDTEVAVRVVSRRDMRIAASAPFSVRVLSTDGDGDGGGFARGGPAVDPYDDEPRRGRRGRVVGAVLATVAAIVVAVLIGMAMAGSGGDDSPAAGAADSSSASARSTGSPSAGPAGGDSPGPSASASTSASASVSASASTSASPSPSASPGTSAPPEQVTVPDVVGRTRDRAVSTLRALGFRVTVFGTGARVASTDPAPGTRVDRDGAAVTVTMVAPLPAPATTAPAPRTVAVPKVVGFASSEAAARLEAVGLRATVVDVERAGSEPDTVVDSSPAAGRVVALGSSVTLRVVREPAPTRSAVPDVAKLDLAAARAKAKAAGFGLTANDEDSVCRVETQSPAADTLAVEGSVVSVVMEKCRTPALT